MKFCVEMCPSSKSCSQVNSIFVLIGPGVGIVVLIFFFFSIANFNIHTFFLLLWPIPLWKERGKVNWKGLFTDVKSRACLRCGKKWWFLLQEMAFLVVFMSSPILHLVVTNQHSKNYKVCKAGGPDVKCLWIKHYSRKVTFFSSWILKTYWRNVEFFQEMRNSVVVFSLNSHKPFVVTWNNTKKTV